ncbi:uncharacterized protein LOC143154796 isoform X1 [Ptiloglossa arizonensis]|uniref:uncharacterized protein LOC143154796 isoform X1 n=1 Tax=Ptiloglossa arizonensis TaxID=3350558 RepID=UPI003FA18735
MPENTRTESVVPKCFSNLLLKGWLRDLGPVRRCELLQKLKTDLQNLGLSRRQVRRGLIQLATKPRVILTQQPTNRRYGSRKISLEKDEEASSKISTVCRTQITSPGHYSRQEDKDAQQPDTTEIGAEEENKRYEETEELKACQGVLMNSLQDSLISSRNYRLGNNRSPTLHPLNKALKQLDKIVSTKMSIPEKPISKRGPVIVSVDTTFDLHVRSHKNSKNLPPNKKFTYNQSEDQLTHIGNECNRLVHKTPDLISDNVDSDIDHVPVQDKRNCIKLNLNFSNLKKINSAKLNISKILDTNEKAVNIKADSISSKIKFATRKGNVREITSANVPQKSTVALNNTNIVIVDENIQKERLHESIALDFVQKAKKICTTVDEIKEIKKKKKKNLKSKFRIYFGESISFSEDEQEQDILKNRFKRRRKKDSIDSCDSGLSSTEGNVTNGVEILKDIQKAVPDSTMQDEFNEDASKKIKESIEFMKLDKTNESEVNTDGNIKTINQESNKLQNSKCKADSVQINRKEIIQEKLISIFDESDIVQATTTTNSTETGITTNIIPCVIPKTCNAQVDITKDVTKTITIMDGAETFQAIERQEVNVPVTKTGTDNNTIPLPCTTLETCNVDYDTQVTTTDNIPKSQENDLHTKIFNELIQMFFNETCQITSNGNVVSIQENVIRDENQNTIVEDTDENSNLKIFTELISSCNKNDKDKENLSNNIKKGSNINLKGPAISAGIKKDIEAISINNNICNAPDDANKTVLQNHTTEQIVTQSNKVPQARLRVLSSAELGSRWCPTPVHSVVSTVPNPLCTNTITMSNNSLNSSISIPTSSAALQTQTVPVSSIVASESTSASIKISSDNIEKINVHDPEFVRTILQRMYTIIQSIRASPHVSSSHYDKLLHSEFEQLKSVFHITNYVDLIHGVLKRLNKVMTETQQLSLQELFSYTPSLKSMYLTRLSDENHVPVVLGKTSLNQNMYQNARILQGVYTTSIQTRSQNSLPVTTMQNQYSSNLNQASINVTCKQSHQNIQEKVGLQTQNDLIQNNILTNSTLNPLLNLQQMNYRMPMQRPLLQQKTSHTYLSRQSPVRNVHTSQGSPLQVPHSSIGINQPGKQHVYAPITNTYFNQQYVAQGVYVPQMNTFYAVNAPVLNHKAQQNINSTHTMQQQNINSAYTIQKQNTNLAHPFQQKSINPKRTIQQRNINSGHMFQQQNINRAHMIQQQNINSAHTMQPIPMSQQLQKTGHTQQVFDKIQESTQSQTGQQLSQSVQQIVPVISYIPQTVGDMIVTNTPPQLIPKNIQQNAQMYQKVHLQAQKNIAQNFALEQKGLPQYEQNIYSSKTKQKPIVSTQKKGKTTQVSLESTAMQFDILKYLSDIQKIMLLKHVNFYFSCITWLGQEFTSEQWQNINLERSSILHFETVLKHLVEKTMKNYEINLLQNKCQANVSEKNLLTNISTDIPKELQITVEGNGVHCRVGISQAKSEQSKAINTEQCNTSFQENLSVIVVQKQSQKEISNLQDISLPDQVQKTKILNKELIQKNKQDEETLPVQQEDHPLLTLILETQTSNHNKNHKNATENVVNVDLESTIKKQNLTESGEANENVSSVVQEEALIASDSEESNKDILQQSNSHLVTVEISPTNDQVTVVDIDTDRETRDSIVETKSEKPQECEQHSQELEFCSTSALSSLRDNNCETLTVLSSKSSDNVIELCNAADIDDSSIDENISYIADIRSITLEAFEKMGEGSNIPTTITEGNIEEEEIKICLFCSKPSTVVCSICLEAKYCSKECAELHWQDHYKNCKPVEKSVYL